MFHSWPPLGGVGWLQAKSAVKKQMDELGPGRSVLCVSQMFVFNSSSKFAARIGQIAFLRPNLNGAGGGSLSRALLGDVNMPPSPDDCSPDKQSLIWVAGFRSI